MSKRFATFDARPSGSAQLDVQIEPLSDSSVADVARLHADRNDGSLERALASWRRTLDRSEKKGAKKTFVARTADGTVAGYGCVQHKIPSGAPEGAFACPAGWYLAGLVVDERFRRRGVASRLVLHRMEWLAERGATECFYVGNEHNLATIALHERAGFEQIARDVWLPGVHFEGGVGLLFRAEIARKAS